MKILFATSEAYPLMKTGGLADVSGSLPIALRNLGVDVRLILPAYPQAMMEAERLKIKSFVTLPSSPTPIRLLKGVLPHSEFPVYLVDAPKYFDRLGNPYLSPDDQDWPDNADRFALFCQTIVTMAKGEAGLGWRPDLVHCNDWQTGLVPALLAQSENPVPTLFTIHNLSYRGIFPWEVFDRLQLPSHLKSIYGLEFFGAWAFMKGGLLYADWITAVSPSYAQEICHEEHGWGLHGLLQTRKARLVGILNGVDYNAWDPSCDVTIPAGYHRKDLLGKAVNKGVLQRQFGLPEKPDTPLIGYVGRLAWQKGIDVLVNMLPRLVSQENAQVVILGTGESGYEHALRQVACEYPDMVAVTIGYSEQLAHLIEAGSDMFVMPSRFEPCGLNQIYSLRYGTIPIVHRTGGLSDTVVDANEENIRAERATGFLYAPNTTEMLFHTCQKAITLYRYRKVIWNQLINSGMQQDFSWEKSAKQYLELYQEAVRREIKVPVWRQDTPV